MEAIAMARPQVTIKQERVDNSSLATEPNVHYQINDLKEIKMESCSYVSEADKIDQELKLLEDSKMIGNDDKFLLDTSMNRAQNIVSMEFLESNKNIQDNITNDYEYLIAEEIDNGVILRIDEDNYLSNIPSLSLEDNVLSDSVNFQPEEELQFQHTDDQIGFSDQLFAISDYNFSSGLHGDKVKLVPYSSSSSGSETESRSIVGDDTSLNFNLNYNLSSPVPSFSGGFKREKRKKRSPSAKEENTRRKILGKKYKNYTGNVIPLKIPLPNPCEGKQCKNSCNLFTSEERQELCRTFWKLGDWKSQKFFLNECVKVIPIKRKRTKNEESRRSCTYEHYLKRQGVQVRVCQQFLIATLSITQKVIRNSIKDKLNPKQDLRDSRPPKPKTTNSQRQYIDQFIKKLPAVHSIYSNKSSSKLYLPADTVSFANVYEIYAKDNRQKMSVNTFKRIMRKDLNIGIHIPMKGRCYRCERYRILPENLKNEKEEVEYLRHIKQKIDGKDYFLKTQKKPGSSTLIASFDLQKVLTTPHGPGASIAFSRKYYCYNFTIYEGGGSKGVCYFWGEKDGKRGANEICSHVFAYLSQLDRERTNKRVHFFCDESPSRYKNLNMLAMLTYFLSVSRVITRIIITFLVPGHTYMPLDSIHANMEKKVKKMFIQAPSEWPTVLRNAHKQSNEIIATKYSSVFDWESLIPSEELKDADGNDVELSELVEMAFEKNSYHVKVKTSYSANGIQTKLPFQLSTFEEVPKAYYAELPINKKKYDDLVELCKNGVIEPQYHAEYFLLNAQNDVPDSLPETDIEDVEF